MQIEEIIVRSLDNGYTVKVHSKEDNNWGDIKNFIAPNIEAVLKIINEWCSKAEASKPTEQPPF